MLGVVLQTNVGIVGVDAAEVIEGTAQGLQAKTLDWLAVGVKDFEFSQNYTMFCDKIERANYFLEAIIAPAFSDEARAVLRSTT